MSLIEAVMRVWVAAGMLVGAAVAFVVCAPLMLLIKIDEMIRDRASR